MGAVSSRVRGWIRRYATVVGAVIATLVIAGLVFQGKVSAERATGPIVFAWMLMLHATQNRLNTERHQRATLQGMIALQKAGVDFRLGKPGEAAQELGAALREVAAEECAADPECVKADGSTAPASAKAVGA